MSFAAVAFSMTFNSHWREYQICPLTRETRMHISDSYQIYFHILMRLETHLRISESMGFFPAYMFASHFQSVPHGRKTIRIGSLEWCMQCKCRPSLYLHSVTVVDWLFNHEKTKCKCSTRHIWERYQFNHSKQSNSGCGWRCVQDVTWPSVNTFGCSGHLQYINFTSPKWSYISVLKFGSLALHRWASNHGWDSMEGTTMWNSNSNCHIQWMLSGKSRRSRLSRPVSRLAWELTSIINLWDLFHGLSSTMQILNIWLLRLWIVQP